MKVAYHAPLPPVRSGVADYAAALLAHLQRLGTVEAGMADADIDLYHLGNNQLHRGIYEKSMARPGVVVLHDAVLHHFYLGAFDERGYIDEYVYNYGDWEREIARDLWQERAGSGMDARYFQRPMLKRVAERALAVVVHNPAAEDAVRAATPGARVVEIPHFFDGPYEQDENGRAVQRAAWGLDESHFVFAVFGYLRESKRLLPILNCFEQLHRVLPWTRLLLAGDFASADLARSVEPWLTSSGVLRMGYLEDREFWRVAAAVDCCLNLRSPPAGETSGIGVRLMGMGKPVFFTAGREVEAVPEAACIRISSGPEEGAELFDLMRMCAENRGLAREVGTRAANYIRRHHAIDRAADRYWETLCAFSAISH